MEQKYIKKQVIVSIIVVNLQDYFLYNKNVIEKQNRYFFLLFMYLKTLEHNILTTLKASIRQNVQTVNNFTKNERVSIDYA